MPVTSALANQLLARLAEPEREALLPHLRTVELVGGQVLHDVGERYKAAYFPHEGIVSMVVTLSNGDMVEAATVGRDGVVAGAAALAGAVALSRAIVQVRATASTIEPDALRLVTERSAGLRTKLMLFQHYMLAQAQQCAACNALHPVERRLARWLLRCRDLTGRSDMTLTQEFLAEMLGVRRSSVSLVANALQRAGVIDYRRGQVRLLKIERLNELTCECYEALNSLSRRLFGRAAGNEP